MSEPAREFDPRASAQDELDSILKEAESFRRKPNAQAGAEPPSKAPPVADVIFASAPSGQDTVRFDRYDIKLPQVEPSKIKAFEIPQLVPIAGVLGLVATLLWIFAPAGIQLMRPRPLPQDFVDASTQWTLVLTAQRIERFDADNGRLPRSLDELDPNLSDVLTFQGLTDGGYILQAPGEQGMMSLQSTTPHEPFLKGASELLRRVPGTKP